MPDFYTIALWNANGLSQHHHEVVTFLQLHRVDIFLISETHFTSKSYFQVPGYRLYQTLHPDGAAHGGTAILVKQRIEHFEGPSYKDDFLQATTIYVKDGNNRPLALSAVYCPPKHTIQSGQFAAFFASLGPRFIAGGDYNAKHIHWGSRLTTTRGRALHRAMQAGNYDHCSTGTPTYWPADPNKTPDLLDFFVTKNIPRSHVAPEGSLELSSDHTPVLLTLSSRPLIATSQPFLTSRSTNWPLFRSHIEHNLHLSVQYSSVADIEDGVEHLVQTVQHAAWSATPTPRPSGPSDYPRTIKTLLATKRRLRRVWQLSRHPDDKTAFNRVARQLKQHLKTFKTDTMADFLVNLSATADSDYSLWKATKRLKRPQMHNSPLLLPDGSWARWDTDKVAAYATHFTTVFQSSTSPTVTQTDAIINSFLRTPLAPQPAISPITIASLHDLIKHDIAPAKAPGYDLITGRVLKELPQVAVAFLTDLFNAILRLHSFPGQWKVAVILPILKPGKPPTAVTSYRPISLLPVLSKLFEKALLPKLHATIDNNLLLPDHQFGFRSAHSTVEQVHRLYHAVSETLENKQYCSGAFLDVQQAFDSVWHPGLLFKLKKAIPEFYPLLASYLHDRQFIIRQGTHHSPLCPIRAGVNQGSVLGPVLYTLFTADLPVSPHTFTATYADDTAILAIHADPAVASHALQASLQSLERWCRTWHIKINAEKSRHITFSMRRGDCPPVVLFGTPLPTATSVRYLGIHLDRRLTWKTHVKIKRQELALRIRTYYWLLGRHSALPPHHKLLVYKIIIKPVWTYGISLWGSACRSALDVISRFENKTLRLLLDAPWYVSNRTIRRDLNMPTIQDVVTAHATRYARRLAAHPNPLVPPLLNPSQYTRRLCRRKPTDLFDISP